MSTEIVVGSAPREPSQNGLVSSSAKSVPLPKSPRKAHEDAFDVEVFLSQTDEEVDVLLVEMVQNQSTTVSAGFVPLVSSVGAATTVVDAWETASREVRDLHAVHPVVQDKLPITET